MNILLPLLTINKVITSSIARSKIFLFNNLAEWSIWGSASDMQSNDINLIDVLSLRIVANPPIDRFKLKNYYI